MTAVTKSRRPNRFPPEITRCAWSSPTTAAAWHTSRFNGKLKWVKIDLGDDAKDADHYIDPEEQMRVLMARQ